MAFKIALSAGHGRYTLGKRCLKSLDPNETREWVLNDRIADKVETLLKNYSGYELLRLDDTTGQTDVTLRTRSNASNNFDADFYLAIHHNAGINGGNGGGIVAYVYTYAMAKSIEWQKALYNALIEKTGLKGNRSNPLDKANLHECREPKAPAVLLELGFMDSATDVPVILSEKYANQCAEAIVKVIVEKGKLAKKTVSSAPSPVVNNNKIDTVKEVQSWLNTSYASGLVVDGIYGAKTKAALVKVLQKALGVKADGIYGNQTNGAVKNLKVGSRGDAVKALQGLLVCNGYAAAYVDGDYGNGTRDAVIAYQKKSGLTADGIAGRATFSKLCK